MNAGPDNVNRDLINSSDKRLIYIKNRNKYLRLFEIVIEVFRCDIIVLSGICSPRYYEILKRSGKKIVYLMHGDINYENEVNHQNTPLEIIDLQNKIFQDASIIACVSEGYSNWVKQRYPQYSTKITFVNNGVTVKRRDKVSKEPFSVAVAGGNRPIKANKYVCDAAKLLAKKGIKCQVYVFGRHYESCEELPKFDGIKYMGHLDQEEYYNRLDRISLFIINSDVESFGLTIADAINCNCSLLMSKNIGARSILDTREEDIIEDNHNPEEIAKKIIELQKSPNVDRLYQALDLDLISSKSSYNKLVNICERVENDSM